MRHNGWVPKKSNPKPKRKAFKTKQVREDFCQVAYRTLQETIRISESMSPGPILAAK
jgi:hypothetical protein